jgi:hypothetical protein
MIKKYLVIGITIIFVVTSVFIAIEASASGAEMRQLEEKEATLLREKSELEGLLVKGVSSTEIAQKSETLGFVKPTDLMYLNGDAGKDQALINTISR